MRVWAARIGVLTLALLGLPGCETSSPPGQSQPPAARPDTLSAAQPEAAPQRSQTSLNLERHYAQVQADLLRQGLLRTDGGGADAPFAQHNVVENFIRVALYDEYVSRAGSLVPEQTASRLRRWEGPVRINMSFGATVSPEARRLDSAALSDYARRLARTSGHSVSVTSAANANFNILVLHEDERRAYGPRLREMVPGIGETAVRTIEKMPRETFCLVFAFSAGEDPAYRRAVAVIRAEHPDLLRLSCLHEEVAQGLGLANDSPNARPSIFNDDEEFALLTKHDEILLRILYDRRLRTGMDAETARPIVNTIAGELMGGDS